MSHYEETIDQLFDEGVDMTPYMKLESLKHLSAKEPMLHIALTSALAQRLEIEAQKQGINPEALAASLLMQQIEALR